MGYLWSLIVYRKQGDVETDSSGGAAFLAGHGQDKLNMLRVRSDVMDRRHVSHLHIVDSMLGN